MTRDRRSAPQHPPTFVWEALDSQTPEPGSAFARDDAPAAFGSDGAEGEFPREARARRTPGRALIAAAVLVPLAGGSYAVVAYSTRHDDTTVITAGSTQAPGLEVSAGSGPSSGPTGSPGTGHSPGAHSGASSNPTPTTSLSPTVNKNGTVSTAGALHTPAKVVTTVTVTPGRTTTTSSSGTNPSAPAAPQHTQTTAAGPATGRIVGYEGLCLDDRGASVANYNPVQVFACNGTEAQQWTLESNDTVEVFGMCLDVYAAGTSGGTRVDLYQCNGTNAQTWVPQSDGALVNPESGQCLDDTEFGGAGTQVEIWTCNGGSDQVWKLP